MDDLKRAIDGCRADPFSMGENDRGKPFNDIALICRDAEHVERFLGGASARPVGASQTQMDAWLAEAEASDAHAATLLAVPS